MRVGIPKETLTGERRVAAVPETVSKMVKAGMQVAVETGAMLSHGSGGRPGESRQPGLLEGA